MRQDKPTTPLTMLSSRLHQTQAVVQFRKEVEIETYFFSNLENSILEIKKELDNIG